MGNCNIASVKIIGTGSYLPDQILTNQNLEKMVDTSDAWILSRTGMKERRIAHANEYTSDMGLKAAEKALESASLSSNDIDLIICATLTPDYIFPSTACLIQSGLKAMKAAALDIQAACSGYLYALSIADVYAKSGLYQHILVISSEKLSTIVNYRDRNTCVLFGDGAAACVVSSDATRKGLKIRDVFLGSDGEQAHLLILPAGGSRQPATHETVDGALHFIKMDGQKTYKHAVRRMEIACRASLERASLVEQDISWLIPHQANIRIIESLAKRFQVPMQKVCITIHKYGNTSGSSVGIALDELIKEARVAVGDHLLLTAFGSGLTWGASVLTYE